MADRSSPSEVVVIVDGYDMVVDDLSVWEFINASSSEDEEEIDLDEFINASSSEDEEEIDLDDFSLSEEDASDEAIAESRDEAPLDVGSPSSDISMESLPAQLHQLTDGGTGVVVAEVVDDDDDEDGDDGGGDDDYGSDDNYDDYDDGYDLDDELVPWGLSDKFGRQRIRKLGKRACPRMSKAKKLPYRYNRPGCVHGKHGFGVQHSYI